MRLTIALLLTACLAAAAQLPGVAVCRVTDFGQPVRQAGFTLDNWRNADPLSKVLTLTAWAGTGVALGSAPFWNKPLGRVVAQVAAGVAVASVFGLLLNPAGK